MKKSILLLPLLFFCVLANFNASAQLNSQYIGTWIGKDQSGNSYEITFQDPAWKCVYKFNGALQINIVNFRIYPAPTENKATTIYDATLKHDIKFFTVDAINGIECPGTGSSLGLTSVEKTYPGTIQYDDINKNMTLVIDFINSPCSASAGSSPSTIVMTKQ